MKSVLRSSLQEARKSAPRGSTYQLGWISLRGPYEEVEGEGPVVRARISDIDPDDKSSHDDPKVTTVKMLLHYHGPINEHRVGVGDADTSEIPSPVIELSGDMLTSQGRIPFRGAKDLNDPENGFVHVLDPELVPAIFNS